MQILIAIVTLLQFATSFLATSLNTPMQPQAEQFAEQVIVLTQETLLQAQAELEAQIIMEEPQVIPNEIGNVPTSGTPVEQLTPKAEPIPAPKEEKAKEPKYKIEIIDPIPGKGIEGRTITTSEEVDGIQISNEVYLGLVIFGKKNKTENTLVVQVTSDVDETQNKVLKGTGNITKTQVNGERKEVNYYPYTYKATKSGIHTITFTTEGLTKSISFEVTE